MLAKRANYPPAHDIGGKKDREANGGENGIKGPMQKNHFERGAEQHARMKQNHGAKNGIDYLRSPMGHHFALVTAGNLEFVNAQKRYDEQETEIGFDA